MMVYLERPISAVMVALIVITLFMPAYKVLRKKWSRTPAGSAS
jgi:hypothetical protein